MGTVSKEKARMYLRARKAVEGITCPETRNRARIALNRHIAHAKFANAGVRSTFGRRPYLGMSDR